MAVAIRNELPEAEAMTTFGDIIQLKPAGENLWAGQADLDYSHPAGQFGGWTAAALLKAVMIEPSAQNAPLSLTVMFTDAIGDGPILISTRPLRAGGRLQFWRAEISQRDKVCAHAQITLGARRTTKGFTDAVMPAMPPSDDPSLVSFSPPSKFGEQLEARWPPGPSMFTGADAPARTVAWTRHRQGLAMDHALLAVLADYAPPRVMMKRGRFMLSSTVSMNVYFHASEDEIDAVGPDFVLTETDCRRCEGGYFDHSLKLWSKSGALLMTSEQVAAFRD
jgi:acyl-CoA thioesterase